MDFDMQMAWGGCRGDGDAGESKGAGIPAVRVGPGTYGRCCGCHGEMIDVRLVLWGPASV